MATGLTAYAGYAAFDPGPNTADLAIARLYQDPSVDVTAANLAAKFNLAVAPVAEEDVAPGWAAFYRDPDADGSYDAYEVIPNFRFTGDPKRIAALLSYLFNG